MAGKIDKNLTKSKERYTSYFYEALKYIPTVNLGSEVNSYKPQPPARTHSEILSE